MHDIAFIGHLSKLQQQGTAYCTVTIVDAKGSIPQVVGASAVFGEDGLLFGTIGGGRVELRCTEAARAMLSGPATERTRFERLNLHRDIGMTCAGEVALYYEVHRPRDRWDVLIFGAGHVAQKLCRFLVELDCHTVCVDTREEWLARLPDSERLERRLVSCYTEGLDAVHDGTSVLVMTMGHATDIPILAGLARRSAPLHYVGVLGSKTKAAIMRRELAQGGAAQDFIERIACPLGDKVGNNTPAEIAVGVLSQLVKARRPDGEVRASRRNAQARQAAADTRTNSEALGVA